MEFLTMAASDRPRVIDGFSSVQAVRRGRSKSTGARTRPSRTSLPVTDSDRKIEQPRLASRIGHTVIPDKHEIVCYECGYKFVFQGRLRDTFCPKCKTELEVQDHAIDGEWSGKIRTIGTVEIKPEAVLKEAEITARNLVLYGNAKDATIRVQGRLEVHKGAQFDMARIRINDLVIKPGGRFTLTRRIVCRNLEIEGALTATVYTEGTAVIRDGGFLKGELHGPSLILEAGGRLKAKIAVGNPNREPEEEDAT
jgi:cytoskeletal protein CcmA (bactofilin family)